MASLREEQGLTLPALAARSGLAKGLLSKLERLPRPNPCYETLVSVAKGFGMNMAGFLRKLADFEMVASWPKKARGY